jgi:hypothetical protein
VKATRFLFVALILAGLAAIISSGNFASFREGAKADICKKIQATAEEEDPDSNHGEEGSTANDTYEYFHSVPALPGCASQKILRLPWISHGCASGHAFSVTPPPERLLG